MKKGLSLALVLLCGIPLVAASRHNDDSVVTWSGLVGNITAPGIDNPVAILRDLDGVVVSQVSSGTLPWTTRSGSASVNLTTGQVRFSVIGLVLNGGNASGTAGPINQVTGTLVCNPGSADPSQPQALLDSPPVSLSANGNALFSGELIDPVPSPCSNPLFLIRIGPAFELAAGRWLATGVEPRFSNSSSRGDHDHRYYDRR